MFRLNRGIVFIVLGTVLFSSKAIMVKYLYQLGIASLELQTLRMLIVLPFYSAILIWSLKKTGWRIRQCACLALSNPNVLTH